MCNKCREVHNKWQPHVKHRVVKVEDVREGRVVIEKEVYCQEHKADKKKYICTDVCITCKKFICLRCRMLYHDKKGHTVQDAEENNASTKKHIESLQARGKTKATTITNHVTCIKNQKKRVTDHIAGKKAEIEKKYQESLKKLNERKAALDQQLDTQEVKLCKILDEMKDVDERLITNIESASALAGNCMKAPLEGDIIVIRDTLSGELKNVLDRDDPEKKLATNVADRAEQLIFTPNNQCDQLNIGQVRFMKCELVCDVELSEKGNMNGMAATPDGRMAVGSRFGGIDIFSADGQLQKTVLKDVGMLDVGFLSNGRHVVLNDNNDITLYTQAYERRHVTFDTLSNDEGGLGRLTVDSNDQIFVGYWKAMKIHVFLQAGGKAIREIPCNGYIPMTITSYNDLLVVTYVDEVILIDKDGNSKHKVQKSNVIAYAAVTQNNSIIIAWVKHDDGLVSIDEYTSDLKHVQTLFSDFRIEKPERIWYYLREFRSGEIAFCTPDRLYIFKLTITPVHE
ncbi:uncharacterized protein LOC105445335 [Strongylocentrotus purpuratus]|uniref:C2H2-type domain-containing protein n=1 Tax=Strongylocentrotus purpuratus TaxID=7668 RepID=A0A7M7LWG3_STRPU|nr:uncharacterized protein LOC105445335 [Strongylocentrotus purpuratus]|eukprot:XP_011679063.1 PREDICTED: uncharacterized protein LOC105445335 [Strongylocentrotus purpuratus]